MHWKNENCILVVGKTHEKRLREKLSEQGRKTLKETFEKSGLRIKLD